MLNSLILIHCNVAEYNIIYKINKKKKYMKNNESNKSYYICQIIQIILKHSVFCTSCFEVKQKNLKTIIIFVINANNSYSQNTEPKVSINILDFEEQK